MELLRPALGEAVALAGCAVLLGLGVVMIGRRMWLNRKLRKEAWKKLNIEKL